VSIGPATPRVSEVCDEILSWIDDPAFNSVKAIQRHLREPLSIAVVGRVKAGKSTLVNALVGTRIAPTAATECTQVVTWYRYGTNSRAELVLRDGARHEVALIEGSLPTQIGMPLEQVDHMEVELPQGALKRVTLVDTPGLESLTSERGEATREAVLGERASRSTAGQVDALLFVFRDVEHQDEILFLQAFKESTGDATAVNVIGVLSHADLFGGGPFDDEDPIEAATERSRRLADDHAAELADVVPVAGLIGETGRTGGLTEEHAATLARLAALDRQRLRLSMATLSRRTTSEGKRPKPHHELGVSDARMTSLLQRLGPYGVLHGREIAREGASALYRWLDERSGTKRLEQVLADRFSRRAEILKAGKALAALERLVDGESLSSATRRRLADTLEGVLLEPTLHCIRELRAAERLRRDSHGKDELLRLLDSFLDGAPVRDILELPPTADAAEVEEAAVKKAEWAQGLAATAAPDLNLQKAAHVLSRSFGLVAKNPDG
jgi:Dynamin family